MAAQHRSRRLPLALLRRLAPVEEHEVAALLWAFTAFFALLASLYVMRPLRDESRIQGGLENVPWYYTGTFLGILVVFPAWSWLVARFPKRVLIPATYHFLVMNLVAFWVLFRTVGGKDVAGGFFVWVSVSNLFLVSVFWSGLVDLFNPARGKRLFGLVAGGGSLGALCGSGLTFLLVKHLGTIDLLWLPIVFLEVAVGALGRLSRSCARDFGLEGAAGPAGQAADRTPVGGSLLGSLRGLLRSPYLLALCGWFFLFSLSATFAYNQQGAIVKAAIADPEDRTRLFAGVDFAVQIVAFAAQAYATPRWIARFGVAWVLGLSPVISMAGFTALGFVPVVAVTAVFDVLRRAAEYGAASPARQVLYTVVSVEEKYRTKNLIDTVVLRTSDSVTAWLFQGLQNMGVGLQAIAFAVVPVGIPWMLVGLFLSRRHHQMAERRGP